MRRELPSLPRLVFGAVLLGAAVTVPLVGCGARGPLEADDLGTNATVPTDDAATTPPSSTDGSPGSIPPGDASQADAGPAGPIAAVIACGTCVATTCRDPILDCLTSESCRATFQCVATTCLGGGSGVDPVCLFKCASGDINGTLGVVAIFQCLTTQCGGDCSSVLSILGTLGGIGGGKKLTDQEGDAFREVMSPWPALLSSEASGTSASGR